MTDNLGAYNEDEYGSVDLFGLDEFGQPMGPYPAVGAGLGAGIQSVAAIVARKFGKDKWAEGIGAGVGTAGGVVVALAMPRMRAMGWTMIAASLASGLPRQLELMVSQKEKSKAEAGEQATEAEKNGSDTAGWGLPTVEPSAAVSGGLGMRSIEPSETVGMPPQLVGAGDYGLSQNPGAQQAQLVGPGISGLGSHFGSTLFG